MLVKINTAAVNGLTVMPVFLEVNTAKGSGDFFMVGLPDSAVRESRTRVEGALMNSGFHLPQMKTTVNFAPADVRKEGTGYDLPLAVGLLAAAGLAGTGRDMRRMMFVGELGLDGSLRPVKGALPIAVKARELGFEALVVPEANVREAAVVNKLKVYGAGTLRQVVDFLNGGEDLRPTEVDARAEFRGAQDSCLPDFADVKGQENVKRACEVAAAGGHNLLLIGSPGCGKSMMAKRIPSILPRLTLSESLETTQIHSVAGKLDRDVSLISSRPFRSPHHTISDVALIGGGTSFRPGEISLAHNGVLFLDELPEFSRSALETLRQPLEDRVITISRTKYTATLPCSFMLVASMNPCPCGYYNHPTRACTCAPGAVKRYLSRLSGPLLDRIDLHVETQPVEIEALASTKAGETSEVIRRRVVEARRIQHERFANEPGVYCNAQMSNSQLRRYAWPEAKALQRLKDAMERNRMSARAFARILRVARTIADLDASATVAEPHIAEAIGYRTLDRDSWGQTF